MCSDEITLEIIGKIEKVMDLGYEKLYVNVDDLENGFGFLRVLCMKKSEFIIVYEDTFELDVCHRILDLLEESEYEIMDFTDK